jgi:ribonuclease P protein component
MLSRSYRLSGEQLNQVMEKGKVVHSPFFWARFTKNDGQSRIAVISPSKIVKTAVGRNQIRRKVYSVIRDFRENILPGYRIVVCVKEPIIKADAKVISEQARIIFVKTGLLK